MRANDTLIDIEIVDVIQQSLIIGDFLEACVIV